MRRLAILATEYLAYSIQYRRLLMRFPLGPGPYRDRLLDAALRSGRLMRDQAADEAAAARKPVLRWKPEEAASALAVASLAGLYASFWHDARADDGDAAPEGIARAANHGAAGGAAGKREAAAKVRPFRHFGFLL